MNKEVIKPGEYAYKLEGVTKLRKVTQEEVEILLDFYKEHTRLEKITFIELLSAIEDNIQPTYIRVDNTVYKFFKEEKGYFQYSKEVTSLLDNINWKNIFTLNIEILYTNE